MERSVGSQVAAVSEDFGYGKHSSQHRFLPHKGQNASWLYPRMKSNTEALNIEDTRDRDASSAPLKSSQCWDGFSFMVDSDIDNGSYKEKLSNGCRKDLFHRKRQIDLGLDHKNEKDITDAEVCAAEEERRKQSVFTDDSPTHGISSSNEEASTFSLKLCTDSIDDIARNTKRIRPSSPSSQHPVCQVDDCNADLTQAKDYHRRHKVCELHSKAPHSLVQRKMQRFCQQCSRFHLLNEFDEGKRSCRRRLAGHNKRRRKPQSDVVASNVTLLSDATRSATNVLSIFATLSHLQSSKTKANLDNSGMSGNSILEELKKESLVKPSLSVGVPQKAIAVAIQNILGSQINPVNGDMHSRQVSEQMHCNGHIMHSLFPPPLSSPEDIVRDAGNDSNGDHPLELNGNLDHTDNSGPGVTRQYLSDTGFHTEGGDTVSSPDNNDIRSAEEWDFFPTVSGAGFHEDRDFRANGNIEDSSTCMGNGLNLSSYKQQMIESTQQLIDSVDSGSDQSAASSSSGGQELSGRIIFKLCDTRRIADIPQSHRLQLQEWLSVTPCFMEQYMRPGCILLTVFMSMHHHAWKELVANLRGNLKRLVQLSNSPSDIWKKGRILVQVEHQRALIVNGKVKRIRCSRVNKRPLLKYVRPIAVVAGQETTLTVCGYNLAPQTKILCVYHEKYIIHEVLPSAFGDEHNESSPVHLGDGSWGRQLHSVQFPGGPPNVLGRFFVEVEHDLLGNILPVIVANAEICSELRSLENELDEDISSDDSQINKEAKTMKFLHELGWIFQSTARVINRHDHAGFDRSFHNNSRIMINPHRFKGLLSYAVRRDWCAVVKKLLDLMFDIGNCNEKEEEEEEEEEVFNVLLEVNLIHQAVKRKCRLMVEFLLQYKPDVIRSRKFQGMFTPVVKGQCGFTPLHLAATMCQAEEMIEILTNDPNEVGLVGWKSLCDNEGRTPEWHAKNSGNLGYIGLIEAKLLRRRSPSVNITIREIADEHEVLSLPKVETTVSQDIRTTILLSSEAFTKRPSEICKDCKTMARLVPLGSSKFHNRMYRPLMLMTVTVAAICATVALLMKGPPRLDSVFYSLKCDGFDYGSL